MEAQARPETPTSVGQTYARLLRIKQVQDRAGFSRSKIYDLIANGDFPAPIKMGERVSLWPESEINAWINALIEKNKGVTA